MCIRDSTYTAALYLEPANGNNANVRVRNNWLLGGGYIVHIGTPISADFTGNRFGGQYRWGICYPNSPANVTASGNTKDDAASTPIDLLAECS